MFICFHYYRKGFTGSAGQVRIATGRSEAESATVSFNYFNHFLPDFAGFLPGDLNWQLLKNGSQFLF